MREPFLPRRLKAYNYLFRDGHREEDELEWKRVSDFKGLVLPRPVVLVNGSFDLLHSGHMKMIFAARDKAATLICAMDSDLRVRDQKGVGRPILTWIERAVALNYMPLDYLVEIETNKDFKQLIRFLKPDLRVQGGEYQSHTSAFPEIPKMFVRSWGLHTSTIIQRCANA